VEREEGGGHRLRLGPGHRQRHVGALVLDVAAPRQVHIRGREALSYEFGERRRLELVQGGRTTRGGLAQWCLERAFAQGAHVG